MTNQLIGSVLHLDMSQQAAKFILRVIVTAWTQVSLSSHQDIRELYYVLFDKLFTTTLVQTHHTAFIKFLRHDIVLINMSVERCNSITRDKVNDYKFRCTQDQFLSASKDIMSLEFKPCYSTKGL
jgi:hypothetical protein